MSKSSAAGGPRRRRARLPAKEGRDPLKLMSTGIAGLDLVLNGGLEHGAVVVLAGAPGTGKTILAQQICFAKATGAHKARLLHDGVRAAYQAGPAPGAVCLLRPGIPWLPRSSTSTWAASWCPRARTGWSRWSRRSSGRRWRRSPPSWWSTAPRCCATLPTNASCASALYDLTSRVAHTDTVLLLVGEYTPEELAGGIEFSLADGIIQLEYQAREPVDRRSLRVTKVRGINQRPGKHTFQIGPAGIEVFPRIETLIPDRRSERRPAGSDRDPRPGRAHGRRPEGHRRHPRHRTLRRRQDHLRAALDRRGSGARAALPVRDLPGHPQTAHQHGRHLRLGHRGRPGRRPSRDLLRPDGRTSTWTSWPAPSARNSPSIRSAASSSTAWPNWSSPPANRNVSPPSCAAWSGSSGRPAVHRWSPAKRLAADWPTSRWTGSCSCSTTSSTCGTSRKDPGWAGP